MFNFTIRIWLLVCVWRKRVVMKRRELCTLRHIHSPNLKNGLEMPSQYAKHVFVSKTIVWRPQTQTYKYINVSYLPFDMNAQSVDGGWQSNWARLTGPYALEQTILLATMCCIVLLHAKQKTNENLKHDSIWTHSFHFEIALNELCIARQMSIAPYCIACIVYVLIIMRIDDTLNC